jgi:hypothetical protein
MICCSRGGLKKAMILFEKAYKKNVLQKAGEAAQNRPRHSINQAKLLINKRIVEG